MVFLVKKKIIKIDSEGPCVRGASVENNTVQHKTKHEAKNK